MIRLKRPTLDDLIKSFNTEINKQYKQSNEPKLAYKEII